MGYDFMLVGIIGERVTISTMTGDGGEVLFKGSKEAAVRWVKSLPSGEPIESLRSLLDNTTKKAAKPESLGQAAGFVKGGSALAALVSKKMSLLAKWPTKAEVLVTLDRYFSSGRGLNRILNEDLYRAYMRAKQQFADVTAYANTTLQAEELADWSAMHQPIAAVQTIFRNIELHGAVRLNKQWIARIETLLDQALSLINPAGE